MTYTVFPLYYSQTENNMSKSNPPSQRADSAEYLQRKSFFDQLITVYGRKPVVEILQDQSLKIYRVHLADSNRGGGIIDEITQLAAKRNIEVCFHSRAGLSRISRNSKQDQGAACDIHCPGYLPQFKVSALCVCLSLTHVHTQVSANRWCQSACCHRMLLQSSRLKKQASLLMLLQRLPFASSESGWWAFSSSRRPLQHT